MNHQCNSSSVVACSHVIGGTAADVLLCNDDGSIDVAACFACADDIDSGNPGVEEMCAGLCLGCFNEMTGIVPMLGPGFWIRQPDGTYKSQAQA